MKKLWNWFRLALSIGLILFLIYGIDWGEMRATLKAGSAHYMLLALAVALVDRVLMAYKWGVLLRAKGIHISLPNLTATYWTGTFLGLFLPATVGADAVRAYALTRDGHRLEDAVSSIVVERLIGTIALLVFVLGAIFLSIFVLGQPFFNSIGQLFWIVLALAVFLGGAMLLSLNKKLLARLTDVVGRRTGRFGEHRVVRKLGEVYRSYQRYRNEKGALLAFLLLSFLENLFPITSAYLMSLALGIGVPLLYFFILMPIVLVLVRLPISIDGIGIQEGAFVYFLSLIGVSREPALLLGIATHVLAVVSVLPGGLLYGLRGVTGHAGRGMSDVPGDGLPLDFRDDPVSGEVAK